MKQDIVKKWAGILKKSAVLACAWGLAGCTTMLSANVTTFQQWPVNVEGQTYRIAPPETGQDSLEYQTYADMIRAAIGRVGLAEAQGDTKPRFLVSFVYENPVRQGWTEQLYDPYFDGPLRPWGGLGVFRGGWGWGGGFYSAPAVVNVPVEVHENTLTVTIKDLPSDKQVFRTTARSSTRSDRLPAVMPYLVRAVFDGFPGNNGQVKDVEFEWK
ncbi:DUF4136 domain-containing protein [Pusillimonas sp. CC-YST705]|uniref:DUF4136 domain-containing protein n=1 Tax=Mesopusillimonas faecipullorum TaxID=2755040 RepID=A0ABS8CB56_9BURK|nr:DUF4136 domain-containing protein [Mesopusillimonas faecipullorum]MCB5362859.1 DUF4136 domain-containing protein [Mesopusillimonas faecipullorum]